MRRNASEQSIPVRQRRWKSLDCGRKRAQLEEAEEVFTTTAEIRKEMLDEDNPLYLGTLEALARVFVKQEAYEKAIDCIRKRMILNLRKHRRSRWRQANNLLAIADCYRLSGVEKRRRRILRRQRQSRSRATANG